MELAAEHPLGASSHELRSRLHTVSSKERI